MFLERIDAVRLYDPIMLARGVRDRHGDLSWYLRNAFAYWDTSYSAVIALLFLYGMMIISSLTIRAMEKAVGKER